MAHTQPLNWHELAQIAAKLNDLANRLKNKKYVYIEPELITESALVITVVDFNNCINGELNGLTYTSENITDAETPHTVYTITYEIVYNC